MIGREDLLAFIDKILAKIARWRGRLLSYLEKITPIRSCLASMNLKGPALINLYMF